MSLEKFGEFLVRITEGRITTEQVTQALMMQNEFTDSYKNLGEILVDNKIITDEELLDFLKRFEKEKNR